MGSEGTCTACALLILARSTFDVREMAGNVEESSGSSWPAYTEHRQEC